MKVHGIVWGCGLMALVLGSGAAMAQDRRGDHRYERRGEPIRFDPRYHHNHYYPAVGYAEPILPGGSISITFGQDHLFFRSGVWWRPAGSRFVVVMPPMGVMVPLLPPDCVTLWIGGAPYYYANGIYYAVAPGQQGYVVVPPPPGADLAQPAAPVAVMPVPAPPPTPAPKAPPVPVIYPRNGQSATQTEADKQACNRWAITQPAALADGEVFQRAVAACMDAHGYTVR